MATDDFYSAVKMLNDKCFKDWSIAFDLLSEKDKLFVKKAMNGSRHSEETMVADFEKAKDCLQYDKQNWKFSKKYPNLLVSDEGNVLLVRKIVRESRKDVSLVVKKIKASLRKNNRMTFTVNQEPIMLHILVYEVFKGRKNERVYFKDGDVSKCRLSNLYTSKENFPDIKKIRYPIQEHKLFPYKDDIFEMRYRQEMTYEKIADKYAVSGPTIKRFIQRIKEAGLDE